MAIHLFSARSSTLKLGICDVKKVFFGQDTVTLCTEEEVITINFCPNVNVPSEWVSMTKKAFLAACREDEGKDRAMAMCQECDGDGTVPLTYEDGELSRDLVECPRCEGTGEEPSRSLVAGSKLTIFVKSKDVKEPPAQPSVEEMLTFLTTKASTEEWASATYDHGREDCLAHGDDHDAAMCAADAKKAGQEAAMFRACAENLRQGAKDAAQIVALQNAIDAARRQIVEDAKRIGELEAALHELADAIEEDTGIAERYRWSERTKKAFEAARKEGGK